MTVTEIAKVCGVGRDKVLKTMHDILPDKVIEPRKKIVFTQEETEKILEVLQPKFSILQKSDEKQSKVLHLSIKREVNSRTLKELAKYLSPEEIRQYIIDTARITSFKQLEEPEKGKDVE